MGCGRPSIIAVVEVSDFLSRAASLLEVSEARHSLLLGVAGTVIRHPDYYPNCFTWLIEDAGGPAAAALMTPPHNLILADSTSEAGVARLVERIASDQIVLPGVTGNRPAVDWFVRMWTGTVSAVAELRMAQGVFSLKAVEEVPTIAGEARRVGAMERPLLRQWLTDFTAEALPTAPQDETAMTRVLNLRLSSDLDTGVWFWWAEDEPVAMAGYGGQTPHGVRVVSVYTPPALRSRGYATRLVAELSTWLLAQGKQFCFLYTDLSNPTSNRIYERIGYRQVAESSEYGFS